MTSAENPRPYEFIRVTSHYVDGIAFSPDGKLLASYKSDSPTEYIKIYDIANGNTIYSASFSELKESAKKYQNDKQRETNKPCRHFGTLYDSECHSFCFTPDGKSLTLNGFIWDLEEGKVINQRIVELLDLDSFYGDNFIGAVSPDLQIALGCVQYGTPFEGIIKLKSWETSTNKEIYSCSVGLGNLGIWNRKYHITRC